MTNYRTSPKGRAFIKEFEQLRLKAYYDGGRIPTIGWGHTGPEVHMDMVITAAQAEDYFEHDLALKAELPANRLIAVPLAVNQFDALSSFVYNCGPARSVFNLVNKRDMVGLGLKMKEFVHNAKGVVERGLVRRRDREFEMFSSTPFPAVPVAKAA